MKRGIFERIAAWWFNWDMKLMAYAHRVHQHAYQMGIEMGRRLERQEHHARTAEFFANPIEERKGSEP